MIVQSTFPVKVPTAEESSYLIPTLVPQLPLTVISSNTCGVQRESVWALKLNVLPSVVPSVTVNVREKPMPGCEMVKLPVTVPSPPADILMNISPGTAGSHVTVPLPSPLIVKPPGVQVLVGSKGHGSLPSGIPSPSESVAQALVGSKGHGSLPSGIPSPSESVAQALVGSKGHGSLSSGIPSPSESTGGGTLTQNGGWLGFPAVLAHALASA